MSNQDLVAKAGRVAAEMRRQGCSFWAKVVEDLRAAISKVDVGDGWRPTEYTKADAFDINAQRVFVDSDNTWYAVNNAKLVIQRAAGAHEAVAAIEGRKE